MVQCHDMAAASHTAQGPGLLAKGLSYAHGMAPLAAAWRRYVGCGCNSWEASMCSCSMDMLTTSALKEGKVIALIGVAVRGQNLAAYANSSGIIAMWWTSRNWMYGCWLDSEYFVFLISYVLWEDLRPVYDGELGWFCHRRRGPSFLRLETQVTCCMYSCLDMFQMSFTVDTWYRH